MSRRSTGSVMTAEIVPLPFDLSDGASKQESNDAAPPPSPPSPDIDTDIDDLELADGRRSTGSQFNVESWSIELAGELKYLRTKKRDSNPEAQAAVRAQREAERAADEAEGDRYRRLSAMTDRERRW